MRRTLLLTLMCMLLVGGLMACDQTNFTIPTTSTTTTTSSTNSSTTTTQQEELTLHLMAIYNLAISSGSYAGTYEEWLESVRGPAGREVLMRVSSGYIQWQYVGETVWNNLVSLASIMGPQGLPGKETNFRVSDGVIQWQYVGDTTWKNLIELTLLIGAQGSSGKEVTFQVAQGFIQWQYVGESTWTNLVEVASIIGPQGAPGVDGLPITLRVQDGFIQWQYVGGAVWSNLIETSTLIGPAGATPTISINEDGYWVINGVSTNFKAVGSGSVQPVELHVEFILEGGILPDGFQTNTTVYKGDSMDLPIPTKDGYLFMGWVTGTTVNDLRFTSYTPFTRNTTLYAMWTIDMAPLTSFFALAASDNVTGQRVLNVMIQTPNGMENYRQESMIKIQTMPDEIYVYKFDAEMSKSGEEPWDIRRSREAYEIYMGTWSDEMMLRTQVQRYETNYWNVHSDPYSSIHHDMDLSMFDPTLFVKRSGENIYDYPITLDTLESLGVTPKEEELLIDQMTCYLDISNTTIVIHLLGAIVEYGSSSPVDATITLQIMNAGTTEIILPMQEIVDNQISMLTEIVEQIHRDESYQIATLQSKDQFDQMVAEALNKMNSGLDVHELEHFYWHYYIEMIEFYFEHDNIMMMRYQTQNYMRNEFNYRSLTATNDSVIAMQLVLDEFLDIVAILNLQEECNDTIDLFLLNIANAYVFDPAKQELEMIRNRMLELLMIYKQVISPLLAKPEDNGLFFEIYYTYEALLLATTDKAEMRLIYLNCVEEWVNTPFQFLDIEEEKGWLMDQIHQMYVMSLNIIGDGDTTPIETLYNSYIDAITTEQNLVVIVKVSIDTYEELNLLILDIVVLHAIEQIQDEMNAMLPMIPLEYQQEVQNKFNDSMFLLQHAFDISHVWDIVNEFTNFLHSLPMDYWAYDVEQRIINVTLYASSKAPFATTESIIAMDLVVDQFILDVSLIEQNDYQSLDILSNNATMAIDDAFVILPEAELLFHAIDQSMNLLMDIFWLTNITIIFDNDDFSIFINQFNIYISNIQTSTSIDEVLIKFNEGLEFLLNYSFQYENPESFINNLCEDLQQEIQIWKQMFQINDPDLALITSEWVDVIKSVSSPIYATYYMFQAKDVLYQLYLEQARLSTLEDLEGNYAYFQQVIIESDLAALDILYLEYLAYIQAETEIYELRSYIIDFNAAVEELSFDQLKEQKLIAIYNLGILIENYSKTATSESIHDMYFIVSQAHESIQNALDYDEVLTLYYYYSNLLDLAFEEDPDLLAFVRERYYWIDLFGSVYYYITSSLLQEDQAQLIDEWYSFAVTELYESTNFDELDLAVNNIKLALATLHLTLIEDNQWIIDEYIDRLDMIYEGLFGYYDEIPDEITLAYYQLRDELGLVGGTIHLIFDSEASIRAFSNFTLGFTIQYYKNLLLLHYDQVAPSTTPVGLEELNELYDVAYEKIGQAFEFWMITQAYYEFIYNSQFVDDNPLIVAIQDAIFSLKFELNFMKSTATEDSIQAMQAVIDQYSIDFYTCTSEEELNDMVGNAYDDLFLAYVEDLDKLSFEDAKQEFIGFVYQMTHLILSFGDTEDNELFLWNRMDQDLTTLAIIQTYDELELLYQDYISYLQTLSILWFASPDEVVESLTYQLLQVYYSGNFYISGYPYEFYLEFDPYIKQFTYQTNHLTTILQFFDFRDTIHEMVLEVLIDVAIQQVNEDYQYLLDCVIGVENLIILEELYLEAISLIPTVTTIDQAFEIAGMFYVEGNLLPTSDLLSTQHYYVDLLTEKLFLQSIYITANSIDTMSQIIHNATILLFAETEIENLEDIFSQAVYDMDSAYVTDPVKEALVYQKHRLMNQLNMMWNYFFNQLLTDYYSYQFVSVHLDYLVAEIRSLETQEELELWWDDIIYAFFTTPVELNLNLTSSYIELLASMTQAYYDSTDELYGPIPEPLEIAYTNAIALLSDPDTGLSVQELYLVFFEMEEDLYLYTRSIPM